MGYKLGIIGPADLVLQSEKYCSDFPNISPVLLPYNNEIETSKIIKESWDNIDIYLFTGFLPYIEATKIQLDKPAFYFPIAGTSLYKTLFSMKVHNNIDISKLSIDTLDRKAINEVYKELKIDSRELKVNKRSLENFSLKKFTQFHLRLFEQNQTNAAITAVNSIYEELRNQKVEVFKLIPTSQSMRKTLRLISTFVEGEKARDSQLIMQIIHLNDEKNNHNNGLKRREKQLKFYEQLIDYGKEHYASVFFNESNEYIILMNHGIFKKYTNFFDSIPIIGKIKKELGLSIFMGIGMGQTVIEAEENAREALELSKDQEIGSAYIIDRAKTVIGPLDLAKSKLFSFSLKSDNKELVKIAEKSDLSISTLTKIKNLIDDLENDQLTSKIIKDNFKVTLRTANRIINKLLRSNLAKEVGYEDPVGRGRPRKIYKIDIPI